MPTHYKQDSKSKAVLYHGEMTSISATLKDLKHAGLVVLAPKKIDMFWRMTAEYHKLNPLVVPLPAAIHVLSLIK